MRSRAYTVALMGAALLGAAVGGSLLQRASATTGREVTPAAPAARRAPSARPAARPPAAATAPRRSAKAKPAASAAPGSGLEPASFPDFTQTDPRLDLPGDGGSYCGPVAVSNWLIWLAEHDLPHLAPPGDTRDARQIELVRELSAKRYMATSPIGGTGSLGLLRGLERWIRDAGYRVDRLQYAGWRAHDPRHASGHRVVELAWLDEALRSGAAAVIHVGWYQPPTRWEPAYARHGGHWLTVVGVIPPATVVQDANASTDGELWLRDPAPYAGREPHMERVAAEPLAGGWLLAEGDRISARDALRLGRGMRLKRAEDVAIVDGAVVFRVTRP